jgi:hypothetical protein
MPNGTTIQSSHTCSLLLTDMSHQARQAHILPGLVHNSLVSVGQLWDNECSVTFTQDQVTVSRNGKDVMYGSRDPKSGLWRVDLKQKMKTKIAQCNHAHDNNNQKYLINYLNYACSSPVKSTWIKTPGRRKTWAPHGQDGWYIGPALEHCRCYTVYITKTRSSRIV